MFNIAKKYLKKAYNNKMFIGKKYRKIELWKPFYFIFFKNIKKIDIKIITQKQS